MRKFPWKISVENLRVINIFHHFPKNTPTVYPDLKKDRPLICDESLKRVINPDNSIVSKSVMRGLFDLLVRQ